MTEKNQSMTISAGKAMSVWLLFFICTLAINLFIPIVFGWNLHDWTYSTAKEFLLFTVGYAGFFIVIPLWLTKGWNTLKKPSFFLPMLIACFCVIFWILIPYIAVGAIAVFVYLHWRFDLSDLGFRSKGWKGDVLALLIIAGLSLSQVTLSLINIQFAILPAFLSAAFRMFGNPASTVENLFYFGFLTERISKQWSRYFVPFLIGFMYTAHEMTNPEYWFGGVSFVFIFFGIAVFAAIYQWRRNIGLTWVSDGLRWFIVELL